MCDSNRGKLAILHLNVNSVHEKISNIDRILSLEMFDIESKLDDGVPLGFDCNSQYKSLRRDRGSSSGDLLVFIRKGLYVSYNFNSLDHEFIYFEIQTKNHK
jgi:hypothetical protein